uniref:DDE_3 domain-containing protein n=1 Tax=Heterorhabditis bacteriophora TaxID=37862 RepID=A0A1I7XUL6_HETBA
MSREENIIPNQRAMIKVLLDQNLSQTKVVFSDESKFNRFGSDGKKYVRRRPGEEFMPKCTIPTIKHGGGSVMVWAAFNRNGSGPLHIAEGIMDSTSYVRILEDNLLPYARSQRLESHRTPMERCRKGGIETKPSTIKTLEAVIKKAWAQIPVQPYRLYATTLCCSYQEFWVSYEVLIVY